MPPPTTPGSPQRGDCPTQRKILPSQIVSLEFRAFQSTQEILVELGRAGVDAAAEQAKLAALAITFGDVIEVRRKAFLDEEVEFGQDDNHGGRSDGSAARSPFSLMSPHSVAHCAFFNPC